MFFRPNGFSGLLVTATTTLIQFALAMVLIEKLFKPYVLGTFNTVIWALNNITL